MKYVVLDMGYEWKDGDAIAMGPYATKAIAKAELKKMLKATDGNHDYCVGHLIVKLETRASIEQQLKTI